MKYQNRVLLYMHSINADTLTGTVQLIYNNSSLDIIKFIYMQQPTYKKYTDNYITSSNSVYNVVYL